MDVAAQQHAVARRALGDLLDQALARHAARYGRPLVVFAPDAFTALLAHPWPGNVRELGHAVERAVLMAPGPEVRAADPAGCVAHAWPGLLGLDAASLCVETDRPGARAVPPGTVAGVLGTRDALVRQGGAGPLLHGEAALLARTEALIRVPWHGQAPALLALACRDGRGLAGAGAGSLGFLGQALAAVLDGPA